MSTFGQYDEDLNDSKQYCCHGNFIGSWWGPDYLCGLCEMGANYLVRIFYSEFSVSIVTPDGEETLLPSVRYRDKADAQAEMFSSLLPDAIVSVKDWSEYRNTWVTYEEAVEHGAITGDDDEDRPWGRLIDPDEEQLL